MEITKVKVNPTTGYSSDIRDRRAVLYFGHDGENILENLVNRHMRPIDIYKSFIPEIVKKANVELLKLKMLPLGEDITFRWSRKAGCSCPCSPGFIIGRKGQGHINGFVIWATIGQEKSVELVEEIGVA